MTVYIYSLRCPATGSVRYIGKTLNPKTRLAAHISKARGMQVRHHCSDWIRSLLAIGAKPLFEVIFVVPESDDWRTHERRLIAEYRAKGCDLTNLTGGGEGFYRPNQELLKRRGEALRKAFADPSVRTARSKATEVAWSDPATRTRHSNGVKAAWSDEEKKARMLAGMRTPEALKIRAEATRRRHADPAFAEAHRLRLKKRFEDPEQKEKLRQASARRWELHRQRKAAETA